MGSQGWTTPWTRLVLHDVYVRTHMTFAAATWAPHYLCSYGAADRATPLGQLTNQHRGGIRTLMGLAPTTRTAILHAATLRWPLEVAIGKAVWRYFNRVAKLAEQETG